MGEENFRERDRRNTFKVSVDGTSLIGMGVRKLTGDVGACLKVESCCIRDRNS